MTHVKDAAEGAMVHGSGIEITLSKWLPMFSNLIFAWAALDGHIHGGIEPWRLFAFDDVL
jgi:hypothetical protein